MASIPCSIHLYTSSSFDDVDFCPFSYSMERISSFFRVIRNLLCRIQSKIGLETAEKLAREPDWAFMKENVKQIAFLFGDDDHWSPLSFYEEISKQVPGAALSVEREGHTHAFSCTESGSIWVAHYVASLIRSQVPIRNESLSQ